MKSILLGATLLLAAVPLGADEGDAGGVVPPQATAQSTPPATAREAAQTLSDFMRLDADRSGGLLLSELDADSDLGFNFWTHDRDGDGVVSRVEYDEYVLATVDDD